MPRTGNGGRWRRVQRIVRPQMVRAPVTGGGYFAVTEGSLRGIR